MSEKKPRRRSRPLRCEEPERLFFVTTRTLEEVFWLHPLLCSQMKPVNREARRAVDAKRASLRKKLERVVAAANRRIFEETTVRGTWRLPCLHRRSAVVGEVFVASHGARGPLRAESLVGCETA